MAHSTPDVGVEWATTADKPLTLQDKQQSTSGFVVTHSSQNEAWMGHPAFVVPLPALTHPLKPLRRLCFKRP